MVTNILCYLKHLYPQGGDLTPTSDFHLPRACHRESSVITDPTVAMLAIVLTGLEEVVMRSTMVHRDRLFRWLEGLPELTEDEEELQRRLWSASIAGSM